MKKKIYCLKGIPLMFLLIIIFIVKSSSANENDILIAHSGLVQQVEWSPDGSKLAFISGFEIYIYDTETWEEVAIIAEPSSDISWHPDSELIVGVQGGNSERLMIWNANTGELVQEYERLLPSETQGDQIPQPQTVSWSPDGNTIATDSSVFEDEILLWDVSETNNIVEPTRLDIADDTFHNSMDLIWSHDGSMLMSSGVDDLPPNPDNFMTISSTYIIDVLNNEVKFSLPTNAQAWGSDDSNVIIGTTVDSAQRLIIWNLASQEEEVHFDAHTVPVVAIAWNEYAPIIASADIENNVFIWNENTGEIYDIPEIELTNLRDLSWQPHSNTLAIAGYEGVLIQSYDRD